MADDRRSHLWIPPERVRAERITPRGGGDSFIREDLATHSESLLRQYQSAISQFQRATDVGLASDLYFQVTTSPERPIRKERQHLENLGLEIVAYSPIAANVATARLDRTRLPQLEHKLVRYAETPKHIGKSNLSAIEDISPVTPIEKVDPALSALPADVATDCLIALYSTLALEQKALAAEVIVSELRARGKQEVRIQSFANGTTAIAAVLSPREMTELSEQFMLIRSIEPNGEILSETSTETEPLPTILQVELPRCNTPVVVIDSGVNAACPLFQGLILDTLLELPGGSIGPHLEHGTFVASRVVYGDEVTAVLSRRVSPWCPIIDVQVTGVDALGNRISPKVDQIGAILQRVIPALGGRSKVFNLSMGADVIKSRSYSPVARLIDFLSREHKVLFVISAGNIRSPSAAPPAHYQPEQSRILVPAEALLALSVASIAKFYEPQCVARQQEISPFSRRGPGADSALKPELAAHGGNVFFTGAGWTSSPRVASYGISRSGQALAYGIGTSYAAPLVSQSAARLFDAYPESSPNLVRALLCHFTDDVISPQAGAPLRDHDFCGFGEPNIDKALFSAQSSATFLYQGEIVKDTYQFIPFHVPSALAQAAAGRLRVRGTLVFDPPVSPDDAVEYSRCRMACRLLKRRAADLYEVALGGEEEDALYPWNPLFHFQKSFRRGYAAGEWELRLRLITRGGLPDGFAQSFSLIIEVMDEAGSVDVLDAVLAEFPGLYIPAKLRLAA